MAGKHILIAEDDLALREIYRRKFQHAGYDIRVAENGRAAITMIGERPPDLFICDVMMPGDDGWSVLRHFPRGTREFPIIMLTNMADEATAERCRELADGYLVKSKMTLSELLTLTRELLASRPQA